MPCNIYELLKFPCPYFLYQFLCELFPACMEAHKPPVDINLGLNRHTNHLNFTSIFLSNDSTSFSSDSVVTSASKHKFFTRPHCGPSGVSMGSSLPQCVP